MKTFPMKAAPAILFAILLALLSQARAATTNTVILNLSSFGWLDQYSLDNATYNYVGPEACVPTSSVNAMTYLQNVAPGYFGTALTGSNYASWISADATLVSPSYMDTTPTNGTYYNHIPYALDKYIIQDNSFTSVSFSGIFPEDYWGSAPYDKPSYMTDGHPTSGFFLNSLAAGNATLFSILYGGEGGGHELLTGGLDWIDANDDGIIQFSENAALYFVDPLDPSATYPDNEPGGGAKFTQGHLWNADDLITGDLKLDYLQYSGKLPYNSESYAMTGTVTIDTVFAIAVPEPQTYALLALAALAGGVLRFSREPAKKRARPAKPGAPKRPSGSE